MRTGPDLQTPLLNKAAAKAHAGHGRVPIVVMPETIHGNPYNAACVLRFAMHFPGFLGGDAAYDASELRFGFSRSLAEAAGAPDNILFIPSIDLAVFKPPEKPTERRGACFYADKFRKVHGGIPCGIVDGAVEIVRSEPGEQSPAEIAELFQTSEVFYAYENTALAIEAVLCGCPAVFLPNPWLAEIISDAELGRDGYGWGISAAEVEAARRTVAQGGRNYRALVDAFPAALDSFVAKAAEHAARFVPGPAIDLPAFIRRFSPAAPSRMGGVVVAISRRLPDASAKRIAELASTLGMVHFADVLWADFFRRFPQRLPREACPIAQRTPPLHSAGGAGQA